MRCCGKSPLRGTPTRCENCPPEPTTQRYQGGPIRKPKRDLASLLVDSGESIGLVWDFNDLYTTHPPENARTARGVRAVLDATPAEHLTFLVTRNGKPFHADAFTHWFKRKMRRGRTSGPGVGAWPAQGCLSPAGRSGMLGPCDRLDQRPCDIARSVPLHRSSGASQVSTTGDRGRCANKNWQIGRLGLPIEHLSH